MSRVYVTQICIIYVATLRKDRKLEQNYTKGEIRKVKKQLVWHGNRRGKNLYLLNPGDHGHQAHHPGNLLFFKVSQQVLDRNSCTPKCPPWLCFSKAGGSHRKSTLTRQIQTQECMVHHNWRRTRSSLISHTVLGLMTQHWKKMPWQMHPNYTLPEPL